VSDITPAASVLLSRGPGSREAFAILRGRHLKFFGGFWAFPGGKLCPQDGCAEGTPPLQARRLAACRELFEETGVLIARYPDDSFPSSSPELDRCRHALLDEKLTFGKWLADRELRIHDRDFQLLGEITTPPFSPQRYATTFFVAHLPPGQQPAIWAGELEAGEWIAGPDLLARWQHGDCLLTPPSVITLQTLGEHQVDEAPGLLTPVFEKLRNGAMHPIFFAPCIQMLPLKTAALPPSSYTNAFLAGNSPRYLIDPGPDEPAEQRRLFDVVDALSTPLTAVVLTHHHPDHIGAAQACAQRYRLPIWAHPLTAQKLQGRLAIDRLVHDGDRLDLGACPGDGQPWHLEALHTPGHASGHLAFFEPYYRLLLAGDVVSTMTSMVIAPPDGDLAVYLQSLQRLRKFPIRLLLPAHGNVSSQPWQTIDDALEHRAKREKQLQDSLLEGPATIDELTARLYRGTPEALMRFARAQTLAGLLKLQAENKAHPLDAERWTAS
jgi:endoribonuclease LACTB2